MGRNDNKTAAAKPLHSHHRRRPVTATSLGCSTVLHNQWSARSLFGHRDAPEWRSLHQMRALHGTVTSPDIA